MKKSYVSPQIEVLDLADESIITMSSTDVLYDDFKKVTGQQ